MTINEMQDSIKNDLSPFVEWFDKYEYFIELAKEMEPLEDEFKTEQYRIKGCQSQTWVVGELKDGRLHLRGQSDSLITQGILATLIQVLDGQDPAEILKTDLYYIKDTGLSSNLSPSRANGLALIIQRIKEYAKEFSQ